jgi:hypothetical protein
MTSWTNEELTRIGEAEELEIASLRQDGTLRKPTTIWVVRVGDELYARAVNGQNSAWFRAVQVRHEGRIKAGGLEKDVTFAEDYSGAYEQIDAAYRSKYRHYAQNIIDSIVSEKARNATIRLVSRPSIL